MRTWYNGTVTEDGRPLPPPSADELRERLAETDYQAIKYAEGWLTEAEYAPIRAQRQMWRDGINRLEGGQ